MGAIQIMNIQNDENVKKWEKSASEGRKKAVKAKKKGWVFLLSNGHEMLMSLLESLQ